MNPKQATAAIAIALAVVASACGSDAKSSPGTNDKSNTNNSSDTGKTNNDAIAKLVANAKNANVKVTYKSGTSSDAFTLIQYKGDTAMQTSSSRIISTGGKSYSCSGNGSDAQCFELPGGGDLAKTMTSGFFGVYASLFAASDAASSLFVNIDKKTTTETIAGREATCVTLNASALGAQGSVVACIDKKTGVFVKGGVGKDGSENVIEATAFSDATAADVKLPATPGAIPGT